MFNPLYTSACSKTGFKFCNATVGGVVTAALPIVFSAAGIYMLVNIVMGGMTLMTGSGDQAAVKKGYGMIQFGIIGFLIVVVSYMLVKFVSGLLGLTTI